MQSPVEKKALARMQEFTEALEKNGVISNQFTCRKVVLNLRPEPYSPKKVKQVRRTLRVSQALFAQFLGVSVGTVQKWERGDNPPEKIACRFMDEILRHPRYWRKRLLESVRQVTA